MCSSHTKSFGTRLIIYFLLIKSINCFFDPISIGAAVGLGSALYNYDSVIRYTYCKVTECCSDDYIPADLQLLQRELNEKLFGQHIVINQVIPALRAHLQKGKDHKKPLVMSFHGTTGTGKNYVSDFIAKSLYKKGIESNYVHKFMGVADFPSHSSHSVERYKSQLSEKVHQALKACPRSLFIFDEVEKMPSGIFDVLKSYIDYQSIVNRVEFRQAIFIFISNTMGLELSHKLSQLFNYGVVREDMKLHDFENILEMGSYNLDGGLKLTHLIESKLIDHFIPFLPLEKHHVEECIKAAFQEHGRTADASQIKRLIEAHVIFEKSGLFATSGCKRLDKKVAVEVYSQEA